MADEAQDASIRRSWGERIVRSPRRTNEETPQSPTMNVNVNGPNACLGRIAFIELSKQLWSQRYLFFLVIQSTVSLRDGHSRPNEKPRVRPRDDTKYTLRSPSRSTSKSPLRVYPGAGWSRCNFSGSHWRWGTRITGKCFLKPKKKY
jgi:hypothetical protein